MDVSLRPPRLRWWPSDSFGPAYIRWMEDGSTASEDRDAVISRAMGVLMEQYGCDATEAFDILVDLAGHDVTGVFTIAALMLHRRGL